MKVERCFLRWKGGKVKWWKGSPETSPNRLYLCHPGQACLTRDPVFWKQPASPETDPITPIRGNLCLLSAYICVNRLTREPVFCESFEVRAGFGIGSSCETYIAGLDSKLSQHGVQRAFPCCKYPPDAWAHWTSCARKSPNPELLPRIPQGSEHHAE